MDTGVYGPTNEIAIKGLQAEFKDFYSANPTLHKIQGALTLARIRTSADWPKLKAKAAACRHIVQFAKKLAEDNNSGTIHDKRRLACCQLVCRFYEILDESDRYLSDDQKRELYGLGGNFVDIYMKFSKEAVDKNLRRWKAAQKFHLFQHLCEHQIPMFGNAKWYWTYSDEDFQKVIKEVALSCHPRTVCHVILYKWVVVFFE